MNAVRFRGVIRLRWLIKPHRVKILATYNLFPIREIPTKKFNSSSSKRDNNAPQTRHGISCGAMSIAWAGATLSQRACSSAFFAMCRVKIRRTIRKAGHIWKFLASTGTPTGLLNLLRQISSSILARAMRSPVCTSPGGISSFPFSSLLARRAWARPISRCACRAFTTRPIRPIARKRGGMNCG